MLRIPGSLALMVLLGFGCSESPAPADASSPPASVTGGPTAAPTTAAPAHDAPPTTTDDRVTTAPSTTPPTTRPALDADPTIARFAGFEAPKPASWRAYPPENPMRAANYMLPAESGEPQAHVVVFQNIGGGVEPNIERWVGQFRNDEGDGPVVPVRESFEVAGLPVTYVELAGQYQGMGAAWPTPDQLFLAAIVEAPEGDLQIRLVGARETVERHREAFLAMVRGMKPVEGE